MNKGHLKRFLHYVFRVLFAPHHSSRDMEDRACRLFAEHLERSRIAASCGDKKLVLVSRSRVLRAVRSCSVVILKTLLKHGVAPVAQSQSELLLPGTRSHNGPARSRMDSLRG